MSSTQWILEFENISRQLAAEVGNKCANLGEMRRIGMPVPSGFVVTIEAFQFFLRETGAEAAIADQVQGFHADHDLEGYEELSQALRQIILTREIPVELQTVIFSTYAALSFKCKTPDIAVAVRSSGNAEDSATAAFAGQYESYLNVKGRAEVLDKTKQCWASLFTARAISYRLKNGLPILGNLMAVIVQRMVKARSAGVAFTALPSTGSTTWVMIEGNWGTAESVVQGLVTPDRCYVNKTTRLVEEMRVAQKLRQFSLEGRGTHEEDVPCHKQSFPCFSEQEAIKIAELAAQAEAHYGSPQDIEWVIEEDLLFPENVFIVQTRPITALHRKSAVEQVADLMLTHFIKK